MKQIQDGTRALALLVDLNFDHFICIGALVAALMAGAYIGTL